MRKNINLALIAVVATVSLAADVTTENFLKVETDSPQVVQREHPKLKDYPKQFDWRQRSYVVPPVKTQPEGFKGSQSYALASSLEAQYGLKYNKGISLSVQHLIDCIPASENIHTGLEDIAASGGISLNQYYPFTGTKDECYFNLTIPAIQIYGLGFTFVNGEDSLKQAVFDNGPVLATFEVAQDFIDYKDGIYSSDACNKGLSLFNHTLLVIGYSQDQSATGPIMYWIVQNSWGIGWGMAGFAKVLYGENICGLGDDLISPSEVWDASIDKVRPFQLHLHPLESESRCLDGSPAGVYFSPGNGLNGGSKKTVVYFEGGGWCSGLNNDSVLESCYDRSSGDLGSSKQYPLSDMGYDYVFRGDPAQD
jgi:hypothetical protein